MRRPKSIFDDLFTEEQIVEHERLKLAYRQKREAEIRAMPEDLRAAALAELNAFLDPLGLRLRGS